MSDITVNIAIGLSRSYSYLLHISIVIRCYEEEIQNTRKYFKSALNSTLNIKYSYKGLYLQPTLSLL